MTDPTTQILDTLRAIPADTTLRVTYQSEGRSEPRDYYGTIESVGVSAGHACPLFRLRTAEGVKASLQ